MQDSHHNVIKDISTGMSKKTLSAYLIGFILSILLTIVAFGIAALGAHDSADHLAQLRAYFAVGATQINKVHLYITLTILAVLQFYVQVVCFLRLNTRKEGLLNVMTFVFTFFIVFVLVGGSCWIMFNLNYNMMH